MQPSRRLARAVLLALAPVAVAAPAHAAESILEEVVVSAQKREQNIQDVGISIQAFTGDQLEALGVSSSFDVATFTPGVHIGGALAGQNSQFTIRGVTQNDFNDIVEAPNAVYLDEGYIPIANGQTFGLFDIERVEVLKGPQGTLFGRNATGGLVHYISRKPNFEKFEGFVDVNYGVYDSPTNPWSTRVEAGFGGPFGERAAGRLAAMYRKSESYLINDYPLGAPPSGLGSGSPGPGAGADMGGERTYAVRGTLDFKLGDDGLFRLSVNHAKGRMTTGPYQSKSTIGVLQVVPVPGNPNNVELVNVIDTPANETRLSILGNADGGGNAIDGSSFLPGAGIGLAGRAAPGGDFWGYKDPDGFGWRTSGDFAFDDHGETKATGVNARLEWEFANGVQLVSITDWKEYSKSLFIDVDSAPVNQLGNYAGVDADTLSQELRLSGEHGKLKWVTGAYFLNIDNASNNGLKAPVNSIVFGAFGAPFDIGVVADLQTTSYSVFGQVDYALSDAFTLTVGARLIQEEKEYEMKNNGFFISPGNFSFNQGEPLPNVPVAGAPFRYSDDSSNSLWAGKVQLDWRPRDGLLLYAGVNRGVKAGSYNAPLLGSYLGSGGDRSLPYKAETLLSFETGFKSQIGDRTRLNGAAYYYDYKDSQAFLFVGVGGVVLNADARTYGAELELQTTPIDGLDIQLGISALDAIVKDVPLRADSPLPPRDVKPTYTPELQISALVRYAWPAFGGEMSVRADAAHSGEFYYNLRNFDADKFDSYTVVNAGIGWQTNDANWQFSLDVRNLTDEKAGVMGYDLSSLCGCNEISFRPPRWYGVSIRRSF
jgi:iron complex outermembrane receptor protein